MSTQAESHSSHQRLLCQAIGVWVLLVMLGCRDAEMPQPRSGAGPQSTWPTAVTVPAPPYGSLPLFTDVAREWGLDFRRYDDVRGQHRILEANGGGVALIDYDNDGWLDVFFTNGCRLPLREDDHTHFSPMFRNLSGQSVETVTAACGLTQTGYFQGCAVGDYDEDGFDDLYVTAFGRHLLWHNEGDGTFRETAKGAGIELQTWGSSAAFCDLNRDGNLDLYVVNYLDTGDDPPTLCPRADSPDGYVQCPPTQFPAAQDRLFLGDGTGQFHDVTQAAGIVVPDGKGLGIVVWDMNRDDRPDIFIANDGVPNFLFVQEPPAAGASIPRFRERAVELGVGLSGEGRAVAGMGVAAGDYNRDGWTDLVVTTFFSEPSLVLRNMQGTGFSDHAASTGVGPATRRTLGFGVEFLDYDNDGWLDLFIANGHVDDLTWTTSPEPYRMPSQFLRNERNGRFVEVSRWSGPYFSQPRLGRGAAVGDLDRDGDLDLVISNQVESAVVLRNDSPGGNPSVLLRLIGRAGSCRSGLGAQVEATGLDGTVVREVIGGGGFQSASDRRIQIGLGSATKLSRLRIRWPSGACDDWHDVPSGRFIAIEEGVMLVETTN